MASKSSLPKTIVDRVFEELRSMPEGVVRTCSWCGATTKWVKQFGALVVCRDCAEVRSTEDWVFFCDDCMIDECVDCGLAVVVCGDSVLQCKECAPLAP